jgi:nucleoside recognition membrane protein YjiH
MEVVAAVVAGQALVFVIAFGSTLAVGWRAVVVAGLVIVLISAFIASLLASAGDGSLFDFSPREALTSALLVGFFLYAGWALGVVAATWARSWAARRG